MRISDWSSDVCSSDLCPAFEVGDPASEAGDKDGHGPLGRAWAKLPLSGRTTAARRCDRSPTAVRGKLRDKGRAGFRARGRQCEAKVPVSYDPAIITLSVVIAIQGSYVSRSEEHTSELQS